MGEHLGIVEILGIAGSVSLLAGWRLYLCVLATGLALGAAMVGGIGEAEAAREEDSGGSRGSASGLLMADLTLR